MENEDKYGDKQSNKELKHSHIRLLTISWTSHIVRMNNERMI